MKENNNTDKAIREKLEGFSVPPPPHVWAGVQGQLAAQRRKKRVALYSWISAAAVVVLALLAGWYFNTTTPDNRLTAEQQIVQPENRNDILGDKKTQTQVQVLPQTTLADNNKTVIESKKEKTRNSDVVLVASKTDVKNNKTEKPVVEVEERVQMAKMEPKSFGLVNTAPEFALAEHPTQKDEFYLTEAEKMILAANIASAKTSKKENSGWKMGLNIAPGYSSQIVNHSESYANNMSYDTETGSTNIGGGFAVQYKTGKRFSIESGVYYAQNGQKSGQPNELFASNKDVNDNFYSANENMAMDAVAGAPMQALNNTSRISAPTFSNAVSLNNGVMMMNGNAGIVAINSTPKGAEIATTAETKSLNIQNTMVTNGDFSQVFDFIEVPFLLRYRVLDAKFGIELVGGVNTGIVVGNNAYIENSYGVQNVGSTQDISSVNLSGAVGLGMNYALGKHISVAVEPRLNYYFNSINSNPEVDYRPYRVGIFTGVYYAF